MNKGDVRQGRLANSEAFRWSGRLDLNQRPPAPHAGALPSCATPRHVDMVTHGGDGGQGWEGQTGSVSFYVVLRVWQLTLQLIKQVVMAKPYNRLQR